jgi:hypothetical protein
LPNAWHAAINPIDINTSTHQHINIMKIEKIEKIETLSVSKAPLVPTQDSVGSMQAGAWYCIPQHGGGWACMFGGTHQFLPFAKFGRTAGRARRNMARELRRNPVALTN